MEELLHPPVPNLLCPCCREPLTHQGDKYLHNLETVADPNGPGVLCSTFVCPDTECVAHGLFMWDHDGSLYTVAPYKKITARIGGSLHQTKDCFIDNNDAPFGSLMRKLNVEHHKHDEDRTFTPLRCLQIHWRGIYKADTDGKVIRRRFRIEFWHVAEGGEMTRIRYPGHMLMFSIKSFHRKRNYGTAAQYPEYNRRANWPRAERYRKIAAWYVYWWERLFGVGGTPTQG